MIRKKLLAPSLLASLVIAIGFTLVTLTGSVGAREPRVPFYDFFSFQGYIEDDVTGTPMNATCDMTFGLFRPPQINILIASQTINDVEVVDGHFAVLLEFGDHFQTGDAYTLGIEADCGNGLLNLDQQRIRPVPYAFYARYTGPHKHLGETWQGEAGELLEMNGSADQALLVLDNSHSDGEGLRVRAAGTRGVNVVSAGGAGVFVSQAGTSGLYVNTATTNGLSVHQAGNHGVNVNSAAERGVNVDSAGGAGVFVSQAGTSGLYVNTATTNGLYVNEAGEHGVRARTTSADYFGGNFINAAPNGAGLRAKAGDGSTPDLILAGNNNTTGGDNGRISSDPDYESSDLFLVSNDAVVVKLNNDQNVEDDGSAFSVRDQNNNDLFRIQDNGDICIGNC